MPPDMDSQQPCDTVMADAADAADAVDAVDAAAAKREAQLQRMREYNAKRRKDPEYIAKSYEYIRRYRERHPERVKEGLRNYNRRMRELRLQQAQGPVACV